MHFSPSATRSGARFSPRLGRGLCALLSFSFVPAAVAVSEPSLITGEKKSYAYSWQQEVQLGAEADKELVQEMGVYDNAELQTYVQAVGERVLAHSNFANPSAPEIYRGAKFTFRIIDSPVVNAFALPGGYVYVTRGLLSHLENEAQLAVVLGHEIGHVAARHTSQEARRSQWGKIGTVLGAILGQRVLGEAVPGIGETILNTGGKAVQMFMLRYSREAENEADGLGVNYAELGGYAAGESARFFQTLKTMAEEQGKALPAWQSTHPDPGDRAQRVAQLAAKGPKDATNIGDGEYLRHIESLVIGEDPRAGFAQNGVFYHPTLRFQMPLAPGWKLENQRAAVLLAEPTGKAMMGLRVAGNGRARDAAQQFAQQNKIQVTATGDTTVNGLPTSVIIGQATTEQGAVSVWNAFIEMDGRVYSLLGYSPSAAFDQMRPTFESVAAGFSPLRAPEVANVEPTRLKIIRADRAAPLASFIPTALPEDLKPQMIADMNQRGVNDNVAQGEPIKVPEVPARPNFGAAAANPPNQQPASSYPGQGPYGQSTPGYPPTNYPPGSSARYPSSSTSYPPSGNPPPQGYPPAQGYPPQQSGYPQPGNQGQTSPYPGQPGYPPQSYPPSSGGYPQTQTYPSSTGSPNQQSYPPQYPTSYPSGGSSYPQTQSLPHFPQPPGAAGSSQQQQQPQPQPSSGPNWPR